MPACLDVCACPPRGNIFGDATVRAQITVKIRHEFLPGSESCSRNRPDPVEVIAKGSDKDGDIDALPDRSCQTNVGQADLLKAVSFNVHELQHKKYQFSEEQLVHPFLILLRSFHDRLKSDSESGLKVGHNFLAVHLASIVGIGLEIVGIEQIGDWDLHCWGKNCKVPNGSDWADIGHTSQYADYIILKSDTPSL